MVMAFVMSHARSNMEPVDLEDERLAVARNALPLIREAALHPQTTIWRRQFLMKTVKVIEMASAGQRRLDPVRMALVLDALDYSEQITS